MIFKVRHIFTVCLSLACLTQLFAQESGPVVLIVGTRPEAIKMIPVYLALQKNEIPAVLCSTGQHGTMLEEMFSLFDVKPEVDFKIMKPGQDLFYITEAVLSKAKEAFEKLKPCLVVVQGDTTSAMAAGMAAFYLKIPVAHVEAGLRTGNIYAPFPEEMNRLLIARFTTLHFPPTALSERKLIDEGINKESICCTGNTVIDALYQIRDRIHDKKVLPSKEISDIVENLKENNRKIVLLTAHRRESFEGGLAHIFNAINTSLNENSNLTVIYPMHPNPVIKKVFDEVKLNEQANLIVLSPLPYQDMVYLLDQVDGVATDSGGIQEEAVSMGKITLVLRNETDRPEGLKDGLASLVGTNEKSIVNGIRRIVANEAKTPENFTSPYGDGKASERITEIIKKFLSEQKKEAKQ